MEVLHPSTVNCHGLIDPLFAFAELSPTQIGLLAALAGVVLVIVLSAQRRMSRAARMPQPSEARRLADDKRVDQTVGRVTEIIEELDQLARQIHRRIDAQSTKLEQLNRAADQRIASLEKLLRQGEPQRRLDIVLDDTSAQDAPVRPSSNPRDERHAAIYRLADEGCSSLQIAEEVGRPTGEIELILSLRRARTSAPHRPDQSAAA